MDDPSSEKQHLPSARKISELKKQGTVLRSKDLFAATSIVIFAILVYLASEYFFEIIMDNFRLISVWIDKVSLGQITLSQAINYFFRKNIAVFFLVPVAIFGAILLAPFFFGGWNFTFEPLGLNFSRLNPIDNLQRIFSLPKASKEILKSFGKTLLIFIFGYYFLSNHYSQIYSIQYDSIYSAMTSMKEIIIQFIGFSVFIVIIFSGIDMFMINQEFMTQHKMTSHEMEEESKETEGSPETRRRVRSTRNALYRQRLSATVPKASVVITNPTHFAVALRYQVNKDAAPVLLAKGKEELAAEIRRIAVSCRIPIYQAPTIARAVYYTVKTGKQIHPDLYMPVAIILSYLRQLENWKAGNGDLPELVTEFDLPDKYKFKQ